MCSIEMKEYIFDSEMDGKRRKLVILHPQPDVYNVYWDSHYIGGIVPIVDDDESLIWVANNEGLQEYAQQIGAFIESSDR